MVQSLLARELGKVVQLNYCNCGCGEKFKHMNVFFVTLVKGPRKNI